MMMIIIIILKKTELGTACSTYGRESRCIQVFEGNLRKGDYVEKTGVDGRIILQWILSGIGGTDWTDLAQDEIQVAGFCKCGNERSGSIK
jgi:hypothetical protein